MNFMQTFIFKLSFTAQVKNAQMVGEKNEILTLNYRKIWKFSICILHPHNCLSEVEIKTN